MVFAVVDGYRIPKQNVFRELDGFVLRELFFQLFIRERILDRLKVQRNILTKQLLACPFLQNRVARHLNIIACAAKQCTVNINIHHPCAGKPYVVSQKGSAGNKAARTDFMYVDDFFFCFDLSGGSGNHTEVRRHREQ